MPIFLNTKAHRTPWGVFPEIAVDDRWPAPHEVARDGNEIGAAIIAYAEQWRDHPDFPSAPWDPRTGTISLIPLDQPRPSTDEVPRYKLTTDAVIGRTVYSAGQEVSYRHWPENMAAMEPTNESARLVARYRAKFSPPTRSLESPHNGQVLDLPNPAFFFGRPDAAVA